MNLYCFIPATRPVDSPTSAMGTPWAKGVMISGDTRDHAIMALPPIMVASAAAGVKRRQNTPSSNATTMGGLIAAVNAECAE